MSTRDAAARISLTGGGGVRLELVGDWRISKKLPDADDVAARLFSAGGGGLTVSGEALDGWDIGLLIFLKKLVAYCREQGVTPELESLPAGARRLLDMSLAVSPHTEGPGTRNCDSMLACVGGEAIAFFRATVDILAFVGEAVTVLGRLVLGRARFQSRDLWCLLEECGGRALPIVTLISIIVGLILAFVGAVQLQKFGAEIYVADLVAIAAVREMGAMMAAIIMAGRTGAAFAAQLGAMQVSEEIDALQTLGISPMEFLVLPRIVALSLMMPLLCLYADLMGIIGGALVSVSMLDISLLQYVNQTMAAIGLKDVMFGVGKSFVFGVLVALAGCLRGVQSGRSASSVGAASTSAVVTSIVAIVVSDGLFAIISNILGF